MKKKKTNNTSVQKGFNGEQRTHRQKTDGGDNVKVSFPTLD